SHRSARRWRGAARVSRTGFRCSARHADRATRGTGARSFGTTPATLGNYRRRMLAAVRSAAVLGVDAFDVTVEVDCTRGLPHWTVVGLPASSVKESRERVSAALGNAGIDLPQRRVTINLAPADVAKTGTAFDLPIAIAVLIAFEIIEAESARDVLFLGELGLDGSVRPVRGVLSVARRIAQATPHVTLVLPPGNVGEAGLVRGVRLCAPASIVELVQWMRGGR